MPSDVTANALIPMSSPTAAPVVGRGAHSTSVQHRATKYFPLGERDIVADRIRPLTFLEIRQLYGLVQNFDVRPHTFALVALTMVTLTLEAGVAGFLSPLHTTEEVLKSCIQITQRGLQSSCVYFP